MKYFLTLLAILSLVGGFLVASVDQVWGWLLVGFGVAVFGYSRRGSLYLLAANLSYGKKGLDGAIVWFRRAYRSNTLPFKGNINYAYLLIKAFQYKEAAEVLIKLMNKAGQSIGKEGNLFLARTWYTLVLWKTEKGSEAIDMLVEVKNRGYKTSALYGSLGAFLIESERLNEAQILNQEALEFAPDDLVILDNHGLCQMKLEKWDDARSIYEKLMDLKPRFPEAWYNYAKVLKHFGDSEGAIKALEQALSCNFSGLNLIQAPMVHELKDSWNK